ncbi:MAG: branched-chain amino acid ABC transporter permease [Bacilli bacterium]|jgi:branched-chain amino acid transport system permease protein|nr:branched-chain amino acid ABC transporter permease [Bacilli bacterium]MDD3348135.1 branched-chain amino acid ABC transporter permease [Bacilli bacterium]MDD4056070.1 branched-chain amino acid ABC transporter permease [Bacilli bacterium]MDY0209641.1 branched-chain amino acid ABC transporter permease [Bacilli bacterium]
MSNIINQLINGIQKGSIYALVALGYTMVYGIIKLINFAHGDFIMVACFVTYSGIILFGLPIWLSLILALVFAVVLGIITEKVAYKPLRNSPRITALITAIAISLLFQNVSQKIFTSNPKIAREIIELKIYHIGDVVINNIAIITICVSIASMILLAVFVNKTRTGKAMRAVSENPDAARLMGINNNKTITITFAIGTFLAGIAAIMYYAYSGYLTPTLGGKLGLYAFVAAVVGGIGIIPGAMLGGFLIGIIEVLPYMVGIAPEYSDIILFGTLILILLFKPTGILGKNIGEKV